MELCEDDTEVESFDGSTSFSSGSETDLDDKPPDLSKLATLANLERCDTKDDLTTPSSGDTEERDREDSTNAVTLKPGNFAQSISEICGLIFQCYLTLPW